MIGTVLGHYRIEALLGTGGMSTVYRAWDTRLNRTVAIKVLTTADGGDRASRIIREARAASVLNHPNIVTVHAVEHAQLTDAATSSELDVDFIVMECVTGEPLARIIPPGGLPVERALDYAWQIAAALAAAHEMGIVHRDIKPANVLVTTGGYVKVLDFGIAKRTALPEDVTRQLTSETAHDPYALVGTVGYISPEQIAGRPADSRSDVFAAGVLMYELLTGTRPFSGDSQWAVIDATVHRNPTPMTQLRPDLPDELERIVRRCLAKNPDDRYASARTLAADLQALRGRLAAAPLPSQRRAVVVLGVAAVVVAAISVGLLIRTRVHDARIRWARSTIPEISQLTDRGDVVGAYRLAHRALEAAPGDPQVTQTWNALTEPRQVTTDPPGADVAFRAYDASDEGWIPLGRTPFEARLPVGQIRWRITKAGYEPREVAPDSPRSAFVLPAVGSVPAGMIYIPKGVFTLDSTNQDVELPEYWLDQFEVTNRAFKAFIDAGGYRTREYWTQPFVKDGRELTWDQAMAEFRDSTGRPGPSTWELGTYLEGQDDDPVSGVSWYEAAAYAAYAHQSLPTVYHWYNTSGAFGIFSNVLRFSNFKGKGPVRVGSSGGLGPYGTYDMAGNVKEWCWNEGADGRRYVLGGAYNDAEYQFRDEDARAPFTRAAGFGFRCMRQREPVATALRQPIVTLQRDPALLKPAADNLFAVYKRLYDYDPLPLDARVEEVDDAAPHWRHERVSFRAAYGQDRVPAQLFLPKSAAPPYEAVVYMPGSDAAMLHSSRDLWMQWLEFVVRSGRAVVVPVYQQTYERNTGAPTGPNFDRTLIIQRIQDLRRTIDYLETRSDIDAKRIAFYGLSLGAQFGPIALATEPRLRTGVLLSGGFETWQLPPEVDPVNFSPRVRQPVLMVNGRDDFDLPYATAQVPMFKMLGTAAADKRHVVLDGGHIPPRPLEVYTVILDWLDKYLGPVTPVRRDSAGSMP